MSGFGVMIDGTLGRVKMGARRGVLAEGSGNCRRYQLTGNEGGSGLDQTADYPSPADLSKFLLAQNSWTVERTIGPDAADRFRHRRETIGDLIVGAVGCGLDPIRLFDSFDVT